MRNRDLLLAGALLSAASLAALAAQLSNAGPTALDSRARRRAIRLTSRRSRPVIHILTGAGHPSVYFPVAALLIVELHRRGLSGSQAIVIAAVGGWATHRGVKLFVRRRRPRTMRGRSNELQAFPSGHTTASTAIAITAAYVLARYGLLSRAEAAALGIAIPATIGVGRVLADQHWATDVIGGWIGGVGVAALAALTMDP